LGLGVSGDSSCADHNIAWRTRHTLLLDYLPGGVSGDSARPITSFTISPRRQDIQPALAQAVGPSGVQRCGNGHRSDPARQAVTHR